MPQVWGPDADIMLAAACLCLMQDQFIQGGTTTAPAQVAGPADTAVYSDQYAAYNDYPQVNKHSVAHV